MDRVGRAGPSPNGERCREWSPNPRRRSFPEQLPGCVAPPDALRLLWRIVLRQGDPKALLNHRCGGVAVAQVGTTSSGGGYRFHWPINRNFAGSPLVSQIRLHQSTEERVARRNWLERTSSVRDRGLPVQSLGKPATHDWLFTLTPLIGILLLSFGLWWMVLRLTSP